MSKININSHTRLPKQQIPSFYGDPLMFQSFWEIFDSSVNSNPNLDKISKFSYLKGLLKDKASDAILGLSLTSENYDEAVAILKSRFGDPQIVIQTNMDVLLSLPNVESCSDIHLLRKMLDVIKTTSRNLRPHNIDSNHYGPILISVIMKKLPEKFRLELSRQMPVGKWDLAKLLEVFSKELASRERGQSMKSYETSSQNIGSQGLNSGSILHVASENHNRSPKKITYRITLQIAVVLLQTFFFERKFYKINLNATIALKLDTRLKIAHRNIVVLLVKGSITFLFVNLKLIRLRKITQVKTRHLKMKL